VRRHPRRGSGKRVRGLIEPEGRAGPVLRGHEALDAVEARPIAPFTPC